MPSWRGRLLRWGNRVLPDRAQRWLVDRQLGEVGRMLDFKLDLANRQLFMRVELAGEDEPLEVAVESFRLEREGDQTAVVVERARVDRAWMQALLDRFVIGRSWVVPARHVELLGELLKT